MYPWGVSWGGTASRKPEKDALKITVPVETLPALQEQFEISFSEAPLAMRLAWENTSVTVPISLP
jgi:hypothetical protein